ncbi:MAG: glycoside hydrolase family 95 protein [Prevotellaceae bacterium]|jgi:alpha-L-fucosidase 2|nr:glycoside hydrolase family 95 protein [Prevotellaceae bacterium]
MTNTLTKKIFYTVACAGVLFACSPTKDDTALTMRYNQPASEWVEALPVGNGSLGAMIFGRADKELIQLNEETLWAGAPVDPNPNPMAPEYLPKARKALASENYSEANKLLTKMQGYYTESYLPLGDLKLNQRYSGEVSDYVRDLNLADAVAGVRFKAGGIGYSREIFASAPDKVIVVSLSADKKGALDFELSLDGQLPHTLAADSSSNILVMDGRAPAHADPSYLHNSKNPIIYLDSAGMRFRLAAKVITDGTIAAGSKTLKVDKASKAFILITAATSFNGFDKDPFKEGRDEKALADAALRRAASRNLETLRADHIKDYKSFFDRVSFQLDEPDPAIRKTIPERMKAYFEGAQDKALETLYFQYCRYLLVSSSRPGGIPANLQGIWNNEMRPPWSANFTTNINYEMNYWPAEVANLSEMHEPMLDYVAKMAKTGAATARNFYNMKGWTLHHNSDIWAQSNPVGNLGGGSPVWANFALGGAWVAQHLFEHYRFTNDENFLRNYAYPLMKGAAEFVLDWLTEDRNGFLVTSPSTSPENHFIDSEGRRQAVAVAMTVDMALIRDLFANLVDASAILDIDADYRAMLIEKTAKLYPYKIGKKGNLQEWYKDFDDAEPHHRHISHLVGLYPGRQISPLTTPEYAAACRRSLELRGDDGTGWAIGWKINTWARLLDGDHAYKLLRNLLRVSKTSATDYGGKGGSYLNLFCAHPPFQIDGNFGGLAGMSEMLIQSQNNEIHLLPALPAAWNKGSVSGLCARGGFTASMRWEAGKLKQASILSRSGGECIVRSNVPLKVAGTEYSSTKTSAADGKQYWITAFSSQKNKTYELNYEL